jgi:hypothetical protein
MRKKATEPVRYIQSKKNTLAQKQEAEAEADTKMIG